VRGGDGDDALNGDRGWDFIRGGLGSDTINGEAGHDFISGGKDDDTLNGGARGDVIFANRGRDHEDGGDGRDRLWALSRFDVEFIGDPNGDELTGGNGNDRFRVRDGEVDLVHCGEGNDHVKADQFDAVDNDCEHVDRRDVTSLDQVDDRGENRVEPGD
jgi:Ca2+-binding RTX toxin-like protein